MKNLTLFLPTLARYLILIVATWLTSHDIIPKAVADKIAADPAVIEIVVAGLMYAGVALSFARSTARKALSEIAAK